MKTRHRVIAGLLGTSALVLGVGGTASAATANARTEGWTMNVSVPNYTWTTTSGCEEVPVEVTTEGWGADVWAVDMGVRNAQSGAEADELWAYGVTDAPETVDDYIWDTSITLCASDKPGTYIVEGMAAYGDESAYTEGGMPGTPETALATTFQLSKMSSTTRLNPVVSNGDAAQISGKVVGNSSTHGQVGMAGQKVSIQRYANGKWQEVTSTTTDSKGSFSKKVTGVSTEAPYRAVFSGSDKVAGSASTNQTSQLPKATVKVKSTSKKSKLHVDVNPNMRKGYWTFDVQKKVGNTWVTQKTYKTEGSKETRTVNLSKGTYRVKVNSKYGHGTTYSAPVTLVR